MASNRPAFFSYCPVCNAETSAGAINCPSCNVNLEVARNNAIKNITREVGKYGYPAGQQKKTSPLKIIFWLVVGFLVFLFSINAYGSSIVDNLPTSTTIPPRPTRTLKPSYRDVGNATPTHPPNGYNPFISTPTQPFTGYNPFTADREDCSHWTKITAQMAEQIWCVYGVVVRHAEDTELELTYLYFDFGSKDEFVLASNYIYPLLAGECIYATGIVLPVTNAIYLQVEGKVNEC